MISPIDVPSRPSPDRERIEELFTAWAEALAAGDSARLAGLHVPHGVFQHPGGRGVQGRDAIRLACVDWLSSGALPQLVLFETQHFEPAQVATANGRYTLSPDAWDTDAEHARGRVLLVAEKSDDRWGLRFSGLFSDAFLRRLHELVS